ncbi:MAG: hypothetical protein HRF45_01490 [Fimbriimonadia bacterium]|jgi:hypothetical protein
MRKAIVLIVAAAALALSASSFGGRNCCQPSSLGAPDYSILRHTGKFRAMKNCGDLCGPCAKSTCGSMVKKSACCPAKITCCGAAAK